MAIRLGFHTKQVLFGYLVREPNGYIELGVSTNPRTFIYIHPQPDPLVYPIDYYLKIGNIVGIQKEAELTQLQVPNGAYLVNLPMNPAQHSPDLDAMLRVIFVMNASQGYKIYTTPATIYNVYPRYHRDGEEVINCMKIYSTLIYNPEDYYEDRDLFRDYKNQRGYTSWYNPYVGAYRFVNFKQLKYSECIEELDLIRNQIPYNYQLNIDYSCVGIYVPKNTSLIMIDLFQSLVRPGRRDHERTLFQEGSVIILENIELRFVVERCHPRAAPHTKTEEGFKYLNPFYVLQPIIQVCPGNPGQAYLTAWCLRITGRIENNKHIAVLVVPEGGEFTRVYEWDQGVNEVIDRKIGDYVNPKPWDKYLIAPEGGVLETLGTDPYPDYNKFAIIDEDWAQPL